MNLRGCAGTAGFSMVEVAVALGVAAFTILTLMALLPVGVQTNKISAEETRAVSILTVLEADLRNSRPTINGDPSRIFDLVLPYMLDTATGHYKFNDAITVPTLSTPLTNAISQGLNEGEEPVPFSTMPRPRFQVTVLYQNVPAADSLESMQARLIVTWPALPAATVAELTDREKVEGFVEVIASFPAP